jgi:hypothetical protein
VLSALILPSTFGSIVSITTISRRAHRTCGSVNKRLRTSLLFVGGRVSFPACVWVSRVTLVIQGTKGLLVP